MIKRLHFTMSEENVSVDNETLSEKFGKVDDGGQPLSIGEDLFVMDEGEDEIYFSHASYLNVNGSRFKTNDSEDLIFGFYLNKEQIAYLHSFLGTFLKLNKDNVERGN